jgi:hypothetical protein
VKGYGIRPQKIRFGPSSSAVRQGYRAGSFADPFERYLPAMKPVPSK